jgi:hypothetical protein
MSYDSGLGPTQSGHPDNTTAPESGLGRDEGVPSHNPHESGMGRDEGVPCHSAPETGMDRDEAAPSRRAYEQGMGGEQGVGGVGYDAKDDYGMGSGRASDQKEGGVGRMFDKIKTKLRPGSKDEKGADVR